MQKEDVIYRQAAIDELISEPPEMNYGFYYAEKIKALPSAQPEIIRCKDCIYHPIVPENWNGDRFRLEWPNGEDGWNKCPCRCSDDYYSWIPDDDWFCGDGKRKEGTK